MKNVRSAMLIGVLTNLLKMCFLYLLMVGVLHKPEYFIHFHGDTRSYFDPVNNFIESGTYNPDYRMPGYGALYFLFFELFHSKEITYLLIVIVQFILSGIAIGLIARLIFETTHSKKLFYISFIFLEINYYLLYDCYLSTESISTSLLIIITFILSRPGKLPLLLGFFFIWLVFLKPIFVLLLIPIIIYLLLNALPPRFYLILFIPIVLVEGSWIYRNALKSNSFIPLTKQLYYTEGTNGIIHGYLSIQELIHTYGGSHQFWRLDSDAAWYFSGGFAEPLMVGDTPYPNFDKLKMKVPSAEIYTSKMNLDSLYKLRHALTSIYLTSIVPQGEQNIEAECSNEIKYIRDRTPIYIESIKTEKPYLYYVKANFLRLKSIVFTTYFLDNIFQNSDLTKKLNVVFSAILNLFSQLMFELVWIFSLLSLVGAILFGFNFKSYNIFTWLAWLNSYTFLMYVFVFKQAEERYFCVLYPIWILIGFNLINIFIKKLHNKSS